MVNDPRVTARNRCAGSRRTSYPLSVVTVGVCAALYGAAATAADTDTLKDVIVTATRRSESAQDIPQSITANTGAAIEAAGIMDKVDLAHSLAGINVTDKGRSAVLTDLH